MSDDVEAVLAGLEQRLRALQAEIDEDEAVEPAPAQPAPVEPAPVRVEPAPGGAAAALERFGEDLRRATRELVAAYDRALAETRGVGGVLFRDDVALEADVGLRGLCELAAALEAIEGVAHVELRAYAGGHAAIDLALDRAVALVDDLRRAMRSPFAVVEARQGRLAIAIDR
jgi:hypothetical protein